MGGLRLAPSLLSVLLLTHPPPRARPPGWQAAVRWLRQNAKKYRIDSERIGTFGSSAG